VFFCERASPQRPSNEHTNRLRQSFPKGSDLRAHGPDQLGRKVAPFARPEVDRRKPT
jgi:IS30 family transposase